MLVYRGETMGLDEPAASIRLKGLRSGSQDYEDVWLASPAAVGKAAVEDAVNAVLYGLTSGRASRGDTEMYKHDPGEWDGCGRTSAMR